MKIGKNCETGKDVKIDLPILIDSRMLLCANSGGGKSYAIRKIVEEAHGKTQILVLDLEGEFFSLREKFDFILVGRDGEIPVHIRTAELLARRLLELNTSAIIDLSELKHHERITYVKRFLDSMIDAPKNLWHPCLVVVDEAHQFAPEKEKCEATNSIIDLATRGRKRGFACLLATQRISKLNKDAAAECNNKFIGRTGLDIDQKRASDELGFTSKEQTRSLRELEAGEFFVFGPAISRSINKIKVGEVLTTHPKSGGRQIIKPTATPENIKKILKDVVDLPKEAEEELRTKEDMQRKITELKRELTITKHATPVVKIDEKQIDKAFQDGVNKTKQEYIRVYTLQIKELSQKFDMQTRELVAANQKLANKISQIAKILEVKVDLPNLKLNPHSYRPIVIEKPITMPKHIVMPTGIIKAKEPIVANSPFLPSEVDGEISRPQQNILNALATLRGLGIDRVEKNNVAVFAGQSPSSSGYMNNVSNLRSRGYLTYPTAGQVSLTDLGLEQSEEAIKINSVQDLHEAWFAKLSRPKANILKVLIEIYPEKITKEELAEKSSQSALSSGYMNNVSTLRSLGLIDYPEPGWVVATKLLFPEGL